MEIVAANGDGLAIAGCEGFIDYENDLMEIERGIQRGVTKVQITGMNDVTRHTYSRFGESLVVKKRRIAYKK